MSHGRLHHVRRKDSERSRTHGWLAQVQRRHRVAIRLFSDRRYGGSHAALRAALAFRDSALVRLHDARYALWRRNRKRRNNTSGIVGVGRYAVRQRSSRTILERRYWQAFWNGADGKRHSRKFSVAAYGEAGAKALAIQARRAALRALGEPVLSNNSAEE